MSLKRYPCSSRHPLCYNSVSLDDSAAFVPAWCAECYMAYLIEHVNEVSRLVDPIIFNKTLYALDLRDTAEGVGPEVIVRRFSDPGQLRTARLRVVMHLPPRASADTAVIVHA